MKTITIDGKDYELNLEQAIKAGVCQKIYKPITSVKIGDIFSCGGADVCIMMEGWSPSARWGFTGMDNNFSIWYSNSFKSEKEVVNYLNSNKSEFKGNLRDLVKI